MVFCSQLIVSCFETNFLSPSPESLILLQLVRFHSLEINELGYIAALPLTLELHYNSAGYICHSSASTLWIITVLLWVHLGWLERDVSSSMNLWKNRSFNVRFVFHLRVQPLKRRRDFLSSLLNMYQSLIKGFIPLGKPLLQWSGLQHPCQTTHPLLTGTSMELNQRNRCGWVRQLSFYM